MDRCEPGQVLTAHLFVGRADCTEFAPRRPIRTIGCMALITLLDAHLAFGDRPLLDGAQLTVRAGERLGLIGRNGTGKSTLLRFSRACARSMMASCSGAMGLRMRLVEQEPELPARATRCATACWHVPHARGHERSLSASCTPMSGSAGACESRLTEFLHRFELDGTRAPGHQLGRRAQARRPRPGARAAARPAAAR